MTAFTWMHTNYRHLFLCSSCLGSLPWLVFVPLVQPGWAAALFLLAPLVVVPLGLPLLDEESAWVWPFLPWLQIPAALLLLPAFALDASVPAGVLTLPWFLFTVLLAWLGGRLALRGRAVGIPLVYLMVGGGWLVLSRLGIRPLDFPDVIVLATAVHFHYAGFALPLLAWYVAQRRQQILASWTVHAILIGLPLVALGITLSVNQFRLVELLATGFLSVACWLMAWFQFRCALYSTGAVRWLLVLSSVSLAAAMVLPVLYAAGTFVGINWLDIPQMLRFHGAIQVFGFALPGLIGWNLFLFGERGT